MDFRDLAAELPSRIKMNKDCRNVTVVLLEDNGDEVSVVLPGKYDVCYLCNGKGKHVNPSIDSHGLSSDDFYEDPDFAESYFSGHYDISCNACNGLRVNPVIDRSNLSDEQKELVRQFDENAEDDYRYAQERDAERRMGC